MRSIIQQFRIAVRPLREILRRSVPGPKSFGVSAHFHLVLSMVVAGLVAYFPYRFDLNPGGVTVGLDVTLYINWLSQMVGRPFGGALGYVVSGPGPSSRPLLLVLLYLASSISNSSPDLVIKILPIFLAIGLVVSSYLFVRLGEGGEQMAVLTALLTAGSSMITVGMWASYYANWLALIEAYLFLGVLLSLVRSGSILKQISLVSLSLALLLTHPWTWILMLSVAGVFTLTLWKTEKFRIIFRSFVGVLGASMVVEAVKTLVLNAFGVPAAGGYLANQTTNPFTNLLSIWANSVDAVVLTYSGLLATTIILLLAFVYILRLRYAEYFQRLLLVWVIVSSVPFAFLSGYLQSRVIYDLPVPILAAGGLAMTASRLESRIPRLFFLAAVFLMNAVYALQSMRLL